MVVRISPHYAPVAPQLRLDRRCIHSPMVGAEIVGRPGVAELDRHDVDHNAETSRQYAKSARSRTSKRFCPRVIRFVSVLGVSGPISMTPA